MKYDFGFGESVCVREALMANSGPWFPLNQRAIENMGYPPNQGLEDLTSLTSQLMKEQYGFESPYIVMTGGAQHGMASILRAFKDEFDQVHTNERYFPFYPRLIQKEGFHHVTQDTSLISTRCLRIIDSPSNPEGTVDTFPFFTNNSILWDAVYNNRIYTDIVDVNPGGSARFFLGSYSKFFGLNGIRLGWVACTSQSDYDKLCKEIVDDTLGVSVPSQLLAIKILEDIHIDNFVSRAGLNIDYNREEMARLEKFFEYKPVPSRGMFYLAKPDNKTSKMLERVGVKYIDGESCGAPGFVRLNLAQSNTLTQNMVRDILKLDTIA
jgi:aspartate/methionine/tyrosine aminotransferase